ncbi:hypothetical protein M2454_001416 [Aequitasia blattaphilus]
MSTVKKEVDSAGVECFYSDIHMVEKNPEGENHEMPVKLTYLSFLLGSIVSNNKL